MESNHKLYPYTQSFKITGGFSRSIGRGTSARGNGIKGYKCRDRGV